MTQIIADQSFEIFKAIRELSQYFFEAHFEMDSSLKLLAQNDIDATDIEKLDNITLSVRNFRSKDELDHVSQTVATLARKYQAEEYWHEYVTKYEVTELTAFDISDAFERYIFYSAEDPRLRNRNFQFSEYYINKAKLLRQIKAAIISEM